MVLSKPEFHRTTKVAVNITCQITQRKSGAIEYCIPQLVVSSNIMAQTKISYKLKEDALLCFKYTQRQQVLQVRREALHRIHSRLLQSRVRPLPSFSTWQNVLCLIRLLCLGIETYAGHGANSVWKVYKSAEWHWSPKCQCLTFRC
jgi:hypothetical protein